MNLPLGARLWIADAPKDPKGMILICPGGGYQWLSPREAQPVARAFTAAGWAAAVVYYTIREKPGQPPLLPSRKSCECPPMPYSFANALARSLRSGCVWYSSMIRCLPS